MTVVQIVQANCGSFDPTPTCAPQTVPDDVQVHHHVFTDENFPHRVSSMTPRLQARIPKCFAWDMEPTLGADYYIWVDSSYSITRPDAVRWFLDRCKGTTDAAFFLHPNRRTPMEEAAYLKFRIQDGDPYLTSRYLGEDLTGQIRAIDHAAEPPLFASTFFIYRNTSKVTAFLTEWWVHISRFHTVDQLALPHLVRKHGLNVLHLSENIYTFPYLTRVRPSERSRKVSSL